APAGGPTPERAVAVVLATDIAGGAGVRHGPEDGEHGVLEGGEVATGRGPHRGRRHHLHQVIDDHVPECAHGVVEVAAVLDPEALGHGDLHERHVLAVPH